MSPKQKQQVEAMNRLAAEHGLLDEENSSWLPQAKQNGEQSPEFDPLPVLERLQLYSLDGSSRYYLRRIQDGHIRFIELDPPKLRRKLRIMGFRNKPEPERGEWASQIDAILDATTGSHLVDAAINVAGTRAGVYQWPGGRVLVRESPRLIEPRPGSFETIDQFLAVLLGNEGKLRFECWLKIAFEALLFRQRRTGQALILIGPPGCGKSRIQHQIITPILAGRSADPKSFFLGGTDFNSELIGSEHLLIEEIPSSSKHSERLFFGERIKEVVANDTVRMHKKNCDAVTVLPFWRLSISLNDNREKLRCLPPLTDDLEEKIILLEVKAAPEFWKQFADFADPRQAFRDAIASDLPAFAQQLLTMSIPEGLEDQRYGVKSFFSDELAQVLFEQEPEYHLWSLINKTLFAGDWDHEPWTGDADDLTKELCLDGAAMRDSARHFLSSKPPAQIGIWLANLQKRFPSRIDRPPRKSNERSWLVHPPPK